MIQLVYIIIFVFWSSHKFLPTLYFKFLKSFLFPIQEDKDDCLKYFSLTYCLYSVASVEGHGLRVSKNTVVKEFIDCGSVRIEGTGECMNQRQSKWQEVEESCIMCSACKVFGKSKQGFQDGWVLWLHWRPE